MESDKEHKRLFYEKLAEYEDDLRQKYDREKFVLSGIKYASILKCLDAEKVLKTNERAKFKHWAINNFKKTTIGEKDIFNLC